MRKLALALTTCALFALQFGVGHADNDDFSGTILLPTPIASGGTSGSIGDFDCVPGVDAGCEKGNFTGIHRRLHLVAAAAGQAGAVQGILGHTIAIKASSGGNSFTLRSVPANSADFDITFYKDLGALPNTNPAEWCTAPCTPPQTSWGQFGNQPETGRVPIGARYAIISCTCVNGTFSFDD